MGKDYKYRTSGFDIDLNGSNVGQAYPLIYGTIRMEPNLCYAGQADANNNHLWTVWNFGEGEVNGIKQVASVDQLFVDDTIYTAFGSKLSHTFYAGSSTQTYDASMAAAISEWTENKRYTAYLVLKLIFDSDLYHGLPEVAAILEGLKLYDLRTGTTAFSDNIVLCLYDYITNTRYGLGMNSSKIHEASWIIAAEYCDLKGWTYNRAIGIKEKSGDIVDDMLKHFRGSFDWYDGFLRLNFADLNYQVSLFDLDDSLLHQTEDGKLDISVTQPGIFSRPDAIRVDYTDPDAGYVENEIIIGDQYGNINNFSLAGCADRDMASQLAMYELERLQLDRKISVKGRGQLFQLSPGDPITVNLDWFGITDQAMRVYGVGLKEDMVMVELKFDDINLYDDDYNIVVSSAYACSLPDPNDPPPSVESPSIAEELYSFLLKTYTRLNVAFSAPSNYPWFKEVEVHRSFDDVTYDHLFNVNTDFTIEPAEQGATYYILLRSVNVYGVKQSLASAYKLTRTVLGLDTAPSSLTGIFAIANDNTVTIYGNKLTDPEIEVYEFRLGGWTGGIFMASMRSPNLNLQGVKPGDHTFYCNTLSSNGNYGSTPRSATASLPDPPNGWSVSDSDTCDYNGVGTHNNTEHVTYASDDYLKCSHSGGVLTGTYTSPEYDLGSIQTVLAYVIANIVVTGAGTTWGDVIPSPDTWADINITTRTWQQIFALEEAPAVQITLKWGTISGSLTYSATRMEVLSALVTGRYFQVEITITDPSAAVNALVEHFVLKYCT